MLMMGQRRQILSGWKEIANYLGKGVRTVQRYEREMGLSIHRPAGKFSGGTVVAVRAELDNWVIAGPSQIRSMPTRRALDKRTSKIRANFLQIHSETGLTFSGIALRERDANTRRRTIQTARKAYDTIMRLREGTDLGESDREKLEANLRRLKSELESLGQEF